MHIDIEISYYPLKSDFIPPIDQFIEKLQHPGLRVTTGKLSTLVSGDYDLAMNVINSAMKDLMEENPSVFNFKITNAAPRE